MKTKKISRAHIALLLFNLTYLLLFCFLFTSRKNYEFLLYVATVTFFVIFISYLHLRYNFSLLVLVGLSLWGLLHMLGGFVHLDTGVLYSYQIIDKYLRFDQFVHMFGFGVATLFAFYILRPNLSPSARPLPVSILVIFIGMGLGSLNELLEFAAVLSFPQTGVGGYDNTLWDMTFNTLGACLAVTYLNISGQLTPSRRSV